MGAHTSEVRKFLFVVKQTNPNLPLVPFLNVIKDVVIDGRYVGLDKISEYKNRTVFLEVLDLLTNRTFFCELNESVLVDGSLNINVTEVEYLPKAAAVRILSTKNSLFRENDQILGIENKNNYYLVDQLEDGSKTKRIVILRNEEVFTVTVENKYLDCEIGVGILYKINENLGGIYTKEYNGKIIRQYEDGQNEQKVVTGDVLQGNNPNINLSVEPDNVRVTDQEIKERNIEDVTTNAQISNELNNYIQKEEKCLNGENEIEDAAAIINDQFVCAYNYEEEGILKEDVYDEMKLNKEREFKHVEDKKEEESIGVQNEPEMNREKAYEEFFGDDDDEDFPIQKDSSNPPEDILTSSQQNTPKKDCIHFDDCDCADKKEIKKPADFLSESDEESKKYFG